MPDWSLLGDGQRYAEYGSVAAESGGTILTADATAHTKGAYVELAAATAFSAGAIMVSLTAEDTSCRFMVDIATGAEGSETVIIPDLIVDKPNLTPMGLYFPISIPAGTRIAARAQSTPGGKRVRALVHIIASGFAAGAPLGRVTAYGPNTATTTAIVIDSGGTANTKGAYGQITAATTNPIRMLVIATGCNTNTIMSNAKWLIDVAIGGAGSETILIPNLYSGVNTGGDEHAPSFWPPFPVHIPAGTRLAVRAQSTNIDTWDKLFTIALYGVD